MNRDAHDRGPLGPEGRERDGLDPRELWLLGELDGELDDAERAALAEVLAADPWFARGAERQRALDRLLRADRDEAPEAVDARAVVAALERRARASTRPAVPRFAGGGRLAAAAAAALALGALAWWNARSDGGGSPRPSIDASRLAAAAATADPGSPVRGAAGAEIGGPGRTDGRVAERPDPRGGADVDTRDDADVEPRDRAGVEPRERGGVEPRDGAAYAARAAGAGPDESSPTVARSSGSIDGAAAVESPASADGLAGATDAGRAPSGDGTPLAARIDARLRSLGAASAEPTAPPPTPQAPAAMPGAPTAMPGAPIAMPGAPIAMPGAPTAMPGAPTAMPGAPTAMPGAPTATPGAPTAMLGAPTAMPGAPTAMPGAPIAMLGAPTAVPGAPGEDAGEFRATRAGAAALRAAPGAVERDVDGAVARWSAELGLHPIVLRREVEARLAVGADVDLVRGALRFLALHGDRASVRAVDRLRDDPELASEAAATLAAIGSAGWSALADWLDDDDATRAAALAVWPATDAAESAVLLSERLAHLEGWIDDAVARLFDGGIVGLRALLEAADAGRIDLARIERVALARRAAIGSETGFGSGSGSGSVSDAVPGSVSVSVSALASGSGADAGKDAGTGAGIGVLSTAGRDDDGRARVAAGPTLSSPLAVVAGDAEAVRRLALERGLDRNLCALAGATGADGLTPVLLEALTAADRAEDATGALARIASPEALLGLVRAVEDGRVDPTRAAASLERAAVPAAAWWAAAERAASVHGARREALATFLLEHPRLARDPALGRLARAEQLAVDLRTWCVEASGAASAHELSELVRRARPDDARLAAAALERVHALGDPERLVRELAATGRAATLLATLDTRGGDDATVDRLRLARELRPLLPLDENRPLELP